MPTVVHIDESTQTRFYSVSVRFVRCGHPLPFDVYLKLDVDEPGKESYVRLWRQGITLTHQIRDSLARCGINIIYVHPEYGPDFQRYVEGHLGSVVADESIELQERAGILYSSVQETVKDVLREPRAHDLVQRSDEIVRTTQSFLKREPFALRHLMRVTSYDYYTYTHSVNVFVFANALARKLFHNEEALHDFGTGALLHDIGKSDVDPAIVNASGRLTDEQFAQMKMHTVYGRDILTKQGGVGKVGLDVTLHHHEKLDGSGYPEGLKGSEVSPYVRILTICDIFDALTTRRSYKDAMASYYALHLMKDEMAHHIDLGIFTQFVRMLSEQRDKQRDLRAIAS